MDFHFSSVYVNCILLDIVMAIASAMPVVGRTGVSVFSDHSGDAPRGAMCADRSLQSDRLLWVQRLPLGEGFWGRRFGTHTEDKNRRGRCPHRPVSRRDGRVRFSDRSGVVPYGARWASPPTLIPHIFCRGRCPHRPVSRRDGRVRFFRPLRGPHPTETWKPPLCQVTVS